MKRFKTYPVEILQIELSKLKSVMNENDLLHELDERKLSTDQLSDIESKIQYIEKAIKILD